MSLPETGLPLDYFAFTLCNGKASQKAYYKISGGTVRVGVGIFDEMQSEGKIRCFSFGADEQGREKFDFRVLGDGAVKVYSALARRFEYFDLEKIALLGEILDGLSAEYDDRTIGAKKNGEEIESLCVYFKLGGVRSERETIESICDAFGYPFVGVFPKGKGSRLYMAALDFSENGFKAKFYFKFARGFDVGSLSACVGAANRDALKDILSFDGFLHGFQIAYLSGLTSYNFYFKTDETIVL